jgi:hypothetical protein
LYHEHLPGILSARVGEPYFVVLCLIDMLHSICVEVDYNVRIQSSIQSGIQTEVIERVGGSVLLKDLVRHDGVRRRPPEVTKVGDGDQNPALRFITIGEFIRRGLL